MGWRIDAAPAPPCSPLWLQLERGRDYEVVGWLAGWLACPPSTVMAQMEALPRPGDINPVFMSNDAASKP